MAKEEKVVKDRRWGSGGIRKRNMLASASFVSCESTRHEKAKSISDNLLNFMKTLQESEGQLDKPGL